MPIRLLDKKRDPAGERSEPFPLPLGEVASRSDAGEGASLGARHPHPDPLPKGEGDVARSLSSNRIGMDQLGPADTPAPPGAPGDSSPRAPVLVTKHVPAFHFP